jgi:hypothetical protein
LLLWRLRLWQVQPSPIFSSFAKGMPVSAVIVETRPTDRKIIEVGNKVYKTRAGAEKQSGMQSEVTSVR